MAFRKTGFDNDKYLHMQSQKILERIDFFGDKLYLEFGGKLFDDFHASRVLPGFKPDSKIKMLLELKDKVEIVITISADDIERSKHRGDLGITYEQDIMRLIDAFRASGLFVGSVVITRYRSQFSAETFQKRLNDLGIKVYRHYPIPDYPSNVPLIVSNEGYGKDEYIETERSLIVVTAPGPGSGKMATCLSQLYHDHELGIKAGYAKFETFPIWNLPLNHPVNIAYEAATTDLNDVNMIDPFHLEAYGKTTVNYNRDVEIFPVLNAIFNKIAGKSPYKSPTDMGVNMAGFCITDDETVCRAAEQEVIRRYYNTRCAQKQGLAEKAEVYRQELLINKLGISNKDRPVIDIALDRAKSTGGPAMAIQLDNGRFVTGKTTSLLDPTAAALLNALKELGEINHNIHLISPIIIEPIQELKAKHLGNNNTRLHADEILIALSISATTNPTAALAIEQLPRLRGCEAHSTVILSRVDETTFQKLGLNTTCEPQYHTKNLYHE
ncbi:MAG: DUF1846 domain-containing protein [Eubacteriales bacterium]|nr:DUF1846 domain-containing protein [Eubacteriales bacterium]